MKGRLAELLAAGRAEEVAENLRPGRQFPAQIRALAETDHPDAGRVLQRQLERTLSRDRAEQSGYWVEIASGLRRLDRTEAMPLVLRCSDQADDLPQGAILAAEAVVFTNFGAVLSDRKSPDGRLALRALARLARATRLGMLDPAVLVRSRAADHLARVSETISPTADFSATAAMVEAERIFRRLGSWARFLTDEGPAAAEWQALRLGKSAQRRRRWLADAPRRLMLRFPTAGTEEQRAILGWLYELQADATGLFPGLPDRRAECWPDAIRCLTCSKSAAIEPLLARLSATLMNERKSAVGSAVVLRALRGHRGAASESVLIRALRAADPSLRREAARSLGWEDAVRPAGVVASLNGARHDSDLQVRRAATAALARLGERAALREFADGLRSEETSVRQETALAIADEGISWLWPELDALAMKADPDVALAACEAVARLHERAFGLTR